MIWKNLLSNFLRFLALLLLSNVIKFYLVNIAISLVFIFLYRKDVLLMKKIVAIIAAVAIVAFSTVTAFAAGLNASEQSVLSNMRSPANMKGNSVYVPASYINQAESYFNTIDMTADQAGRINGLISQGRSFLEGTGKASVSELTSAEKQTLLGYASAAAGVLKMSAAAGSDKSKVKIISKSGSVVVDDSGNVIKATGTESQLLSIVLISVLGGLFVLSSYGLIKGKRM